MINIALEEWKTVPWMNEITRREGEGGGSSRGEQKGRRATGKGIWCQPVWTRETEIRALSPCPPSSSFSLLTRHCSFVLVGSNWLLNPRQLLPPLIIFPRQPLPPESPHRNPHVNVIPHSAHSLALPSHSRRQLSGVTHSNFCSLHQRTLPKSPQLLFGTSCSRWHQWNVACLELLWHWSAVFGYWPLEPGNIH